MNKILSFSSWQTELESILLNVSYTQLVLDAFSPTLNQDFMKKNTQGKKVKGSYLERGSGPEK